MDKVEEITEKGDQYAKRMLVRMREQNQSPECQSKTLRRRLSIMEAIYKSGVNPGHGAGQSKHYRGNPFEKEFSITTTDASFESKHPDVVPDIPAEEHSSSETYCVETRLETSTYELSNESETQPVKSLSPSNDNSNIEYRCSNQFRRESRQGEVAAERKSCDASRKMSQVERNKARISLGEYFGARSHKDLNSHNFFGKKYEAESEQEKRDSRQKGPNLYFGARVLEILEPEVVQVEDRKSVASNRRATGLNFPGPEETQVSELANPELESETTSFVSEDIRELEREIEQLQFQPDAEDLADRQSPLTISDTPKRLYPSLTSLKRMSDNFTPKKLFDSREEDRDYQILGTDMNANETAILDDSQKAVSPEKENFMTPMPIPDSQMNNLNNKQQTSQDSPTMSFLKRNTTFLFNNLHKPKTTRQKPNHESTRKIYSGEKSAMSPLSQGCSSISTITMGNTITSPDAYEPKQKSQQQRYVQGRLLRSQPNTDSTIPYEVENFLEIALGSELCNTSVTYENVNSRDRTYSHINASELISEDRTPIRNKIQVMRVPMTEPPKHSSTLNRTLSIYKTLTQRIKQKFRGSVKDDLKPLSSSVLPNGINPLDDSVKVLLNEMEKQQTYIYQASKALDLCNSMREFVGSRERVESERQLLLANLRKSAAVDEIQRLAIQRTEETPCRERAEIILDELSIQLREDVLRRERQSGDVLEWFVLVANEGPLVWATEAVACPESGSRLYFPGQLAITNLTPNFRLSIRIYSLKLQQIPFNHEDKYHIAKHDDGCNDSPTCPSPNKLLRRSDKRKPIISPKQYEIRFSGIRESSFVLCGCIDLMLHDLNVMPPWPLTAVSPMSILRGTIDLILKHKLRLSVSHAGFLTHGEETVGLAIWNRRWCVLEGRNLYFWNYPHEQECKSPLCAIDLANCVLQRIGIVDRSLCAKPRTLLIETARRRNDRDDIVVESRSSFGVVRNFLSCDTHQDLVQWQSKLNYVVTALREWNMINTKS